MSHMLKLSDKDCKAAIIKIFQQAILLRKLKKIEYLSKETEVILKESKRLYIWKINNRNKSLLDEPNKRMEMAEYGIRISEDRSGDYQSLQQRETHWRKEIEP